jgi:hemolysin III
MIGLEPYHDLYRDRLSASATPADSRCKPMCRGWLHAIASVCSLCVAVPVLSRGSGSTPHLEAQVIFCIAMVLLYSVSALYHVFDWRESVRRWLASLDYANIYFFIAASLTPIACMASEGRARTALLTVVWSAAVAGMVVTSLTGAVSRRLRTVLYVLLASAGAAALLALQAQPPARVLGLLLGGGSAYLLGAAVYGYRKPDPFPAIFGFHEVFHALVIVANVATGSAIWLWVSAPV